MGLGWERSPQLTWGLINVPLNECKIMRILKIGPKIIVILLVPNPFASFDVVCPLIGTSWSSVCISSAFCLWQFPISIQQLPLLLKLPCMWHYSDVIALKDLSNRGEGSQHHRGRRGQILLLCHVKLWAQEAGILKTVLRMVLLPWRSGSRAVWVEADQLLCKRQDDLVGLGLGWPAPIFKGICLFFFFGHLFSGASEADLYSVNSSAVTWTWVCTGLLHCITPWWPCIFRKQSKATLCWVNKLCTPRTRTAALNETTHTCACTHTHTYCF